uniref:Uncharacterized protein LOC105642673 n=1 Tax=Rhizophora mucronata TaxID=61149 RepID=A0A2P2LNL3_RHIMU
MTGGEKGLEPVRTGILLEDPYWTRNTTALRTDSGLHNERIALLEKWWVPRRVGDGTEEMAVEAIFFQIPRQKSLN